MKTIQLTYYQKAKFLFHPDQEGDGVLHGFFEWNESIREAYASIADMVEEDDACWYLDDEGNRLGDEALFEKSPWAATSNPEKKLVQRFMNMKTGEARFATGPWFRIGNWG